MTLHSFAENTSSYFLLRDTTLRNITSNNIKLHYTYTLSHTLALSLSPSFSHSLSLSLTAILSVSSKNTSVGTRMMVKGAREGQSKGKLWSRRQAILTGRVHKQFHLTVPASVSSSSLSLLCRSLRFV